MSRVAIALGSNLGESLTILTQAIAMIKQANDIKLEAQSSWYETLPIGPPQPNYINGCIILDVSMSCEDLLLYLLQIEQIFGRVRLQRDGPRTLDLDILLYDNLIYHSASLQIPHPRMNQRAFVLVPLAEIAPNWIEPISGKPIVELLSLVDQTGIRKL